MEEQIKQYEKSLPSSLGQSNELNGVSKTNKLDSLVAGMSLDIDKAKANFIKELERIKLIHSSPYTAINVDIKVSYCFEDFADRI